MWNRLRYLLLPFSWLYGLAIWIRHLLYNRGALPWIQYNKAVIGVGNLVMGGAGKTPMIEYLIRLLSERYRLVTLSRGYGRETRGIREVRLTDDILEAGDEPLQFKRKFPQITVVVSEDRVKGVECFFDETDVFLLDDSFQHRALKPGLNLLLFEYESLLKPKVLFPAGDFRDLFNQRKRAQGLVVTKTPHAVSEQEKQIITDILKPGKDQWLLFSYLRYGMPYQIGSEDENTHVFRQSSTVLLVTGIANPKPLSEYLRGLGKKVIMMSFRDHHNFALSDLRKIVDRFGGVEDEHKIVVTTEKDETRLRQESFSDFFRQVPFFVLPVEMEFNPQDEHFLEKKILQYCSHYDY